VPTLADCKESSDTAVALLTGGADKPYAFGLATALISQGMVLDLIGGDDLDLPEFDGKPGVNFLNLRGNQRTEASFTAKARRVAMFYARLIRYTAKAKPGIFHILWNNKFESLDRTLLMLHYRWLGKKVVLTVHNVNAGRRDANDTRFNRLTLRIQYRLAHHLFVHTERMKQELIEEWGARVDRITVIPFGINNAVPNTSLTPEAAKEQLKIGDGKKTILFFGHIAPYKGLEYLLAAYRQISARRDDYRLIIAGRPKNCAAYWETIREMLRDDVERGTVLLKAEFIPDEETEVYFKAADVLVLPYRHIYQSGVLFLGHSFGLPVLAADVGSLKDEIVEGLTGFVFKPEDPVDLEKVIERYFASGLYTDLANRRQGIRDRATEHHSWDVVGRTTKSVYAALLSQPLPTGPLDRDARSASVKSHS
jgi:D-inositol-3-phosphate glycosyltransferase